MSLKPLQGPFPSQQHPPHLIMVGMLLPPQTPLSSKAMPRGCAWPSSSLRSSTYSKCHFSSRATSSTGIHSKCLHLGSWVGRRLPITLPSCLLAQQWGHPLAGNPMDSHLSKSLGKLQISLEDVVEVAEEDGHDDDQLQPVFLLLSAIHSVSI